MDRVATTLLSQARAAAENARWLDALDLAAQALAADPTQTEAAGIVGTARRQLTAQASTNEGLRQITVVVVDLAGSTTIAARLGPEPMRQLMLDLYEICIGAVSSYEGRVLKYTGDGVMAQFGYPVAHDDDARRAVLAALNVVDTIAARAAEWRSRYGEALLVRVGIDSGAVAVGPVASHPWAAEELAGDPPNVATRVQASATPLTVRVTGATHRLIEGWFQTEPVGTVELRNFPEPVALHHVIGPTDAQTRSEARRSPGPPLIGRDAEVDRLTAAWVRVGGGERQVVTITGEAGIGKSRITEQLVGTATATGAFHLVLACSRLHGSSPLWPVVSALARFFQISPAKDVSDELWQQAIGQRLAQLPDLGLPIERTVALLSHLLGVGPAPELQPEVLRRETFDTLVGLLEAIASGASLLLCADDVDAADPSTVELLEVLLGRPPAPMLVLLTGRGPLPALGSPDAAIELSGLPASEAQQLVRSVAPRIDAGTAARLVARSGGVPFVLEEQARAVHELPGGSSAESGELSMFLAARLDELGARGRELVGEIAVAGEEVRLDVVRRLSGIASDHLDELVADLCARRVLLRLSGPSGESVRFRHALLCDAAYQSLLASRRESLHERVATILAAVSPAPAPEDIARHHGLGANHGEAARRWLQAASASADNGALVEAIGQFRHSLSELAHLPDDPQRAAIELDVQFRLGNALSTAQGFTSHEALDAFQRAVALGESLDDSTTIFGPLWGMWTYWFVRGEHSVSTPLASRLLAIGRQPGVDPRYEWTAATIVGYQRLFLGDIAGARDQLLVGSRHIGVEPVAEFPHDFSFIGGCALSVALWFLGDLAESREVGAQTLERASALDPGDPTAAYTRCWVGCWLAWRAQLDGDPRSAIELATAASESALRHGYATWIGASMGHIAIARCSMGEAETALPMLSATVDAWRAAGCDEHGTQVHPVLMTPYFAGRLIEARLAAGQTDGALEQIDRLLADTASNGEHFWDDELHEIRHRVERGAARAGRFQARHLNIARTEPLEPA